MHTIKLTICLGVLLAGSFVFSHEAGAANYSWADNTLLKIDGVEFTTDDYSQWWENWRDKNTPVPETMEEYIDWLLFVREAERMLLFEDAQYQHDILVYLKVLSLIQLKNDEIDSKIVSNDDVLWNFYQESFVPEWTLNSIIFVDEESAEEAYRDILAGTKKLQDYVKIAGEKSKKAQAQSSHGKEVIDVEALKNMTTAEEKLLGVQQMLKKRPFNSEKEWVETLRSVPAGSYSKPLPWQGSYVLINPVSIFEGDRSDFEKKKNQVKLRHRKNQEGILTTALIQQLMKKFNVVIDNDRIARLDFESESPVVSDDPVITIGEIKVTEQQILEKVKKDIAFNKQYGFKIDTLALANRVVSGILSQTLITLESLDRHYELEPPVSVLVNFKKKNKLVKMLEQQIRAQVNTVSKKGLEEYYTENRADFTSQAIFRMAVVSGEEEPLKKIWIDVVVNGKDVMSVAEERLGHEPKTQKYPANHLDPDVRKVAAKLAKGDLSQIFYANEKYNMIYLIDYTPEQTTPFDSVQGTIRKKIIEERYSTAKEEYIKKLQADAEIDINKDAWATLRNDLIGKDEQQ